MTRVPGGGPLGALYGVLVDARNKAYETGRKTPQSLDRPVVSVGNLALGGTGKTPFVAELARLLSAEGWLTCILSRGYGRAGSDAPRIVSDMHRVREGATTAGDEPFLLARQLPGVSVVVGADRVAAGRLAQEQLPVHVFILDDGFQHRALKRDIDIVMLDASDPWRGGLLPQGRLRERPEALARASLIVLSRTHRASAEGLQGLKEDLARLAPKVPVLATRAWIPGVRPVPHGRAESLAAIKGRRVLGFAGIARPEAFWQDLEQVGCSLVGRRAFRDHHPYSLDDVRSLARQAEEVGADCMVTTEKDAVRLPSLPAGAPQCWSLRLRLLPEDQAGLTRFLLERLPATKGGKPLR